jgi:hypothetical protein
MFPGVRVVRDGSQDAGHTELAFDIVEATNVLGKGPLESANVAVELQAVSVIGTRVQKEGAGEGRTSRN